MDRRKHIRRGFSLVEAAIVLAVVGLVVAGIWVAAATMYEDYKVNKTFQEILTAAKNIQGLISLQNAAAIGIGDSNITSTVIAANLFPKDWVNGNQLKNPFGTGSQVWSYYDGSSDKFYIQLYNLKQSTCVKLVVKASNIGAMMHDVAPAWSPQAHRRSSLARIFVNYPSWETTTFPVSPETATAACAMASNTPSRDKEVYFYFGYTRIN